MTMADSKLRVGVAGAGHFGRYHALKVAASARTQLSGIYDPHLERAKTLGWEAGAKEMGFETLLAISDALIVAAPAKAHYDLALRALRVGKHVLVEKPIAATLAQWTNWAGWRSNAGWCCRLGTWSGSPPPIRRWPARSAPRCTSRQLGSPRSSHAERMSR
jgi:hypothetical protein